MTKAELIEMVGNEEQANYAMEIVLSQVKQDFVESAIKAKLAETENRMKELEAEDIIYNDNGSKRVNWKNSDKNIAKQLEADSLIYIRNRLTSMLAVRQ